MYRRRRYGRGIYGSSKHRTGYGGGKQAIGQAGMRFIEANMNPFGSDTIGPKSFRSVIPDGNGSVSAPVCLTCSVTIPADTNQGYGLIGLNLAGYGTEDATKARCQAITINRGTTTSLGTTTLSGGWSESTIFSASATTHKKFRIVGAGLRVYPISNIDNTAGIATAAMSPYQAAYVTAATDTTFTTSAVATVFTPFKIEESHSLVGPRAGICVRRSYQNIDHEYSTCPEFHASTGTDTTHVNRSSTCGNMPMIYYESVGANTSLRVDAVLHLEIQVSSTQYPSFLANSPAELGMSSIIAFVNSHESVVPGTGFRTWVRRK